MTRWLRLLWKLLLALFSACTFACVAAWGVLLTTLCSNPRTPVPATQHVNAYSCHGMTVFISPLENAMLHWLVPLGGLFIFLSLCAAAMVMHGYAKVRVRVEVR